MHLRRLQCFNDQLVTKKYSVRHTTYKEDVWPCNKTCLAAKLARPQAVMFWRSKLLLVSCGDQKHWSVVPSDDAAATSELMFRNR